MGFRAHATTYEVVERFKMSLENIFEVFKSLSYKEITG